jgi:hypothetical protein
MKAWEIRCDGAAYTIATCLKRADALCPAGFDIINSSEGQAGGAIVPNTFTGGAMLIPMSKRSIIAACKSQPTTHSE